MTANNNEFVSDVAVDSEQCEAVINRENFERNLSNTWGYSNVGIEAKRAAMSMLATKTGMYARIPLMCKAESCPYSDSCSLLPYNLAPIGEPCPVETAQIEIRYAGYEKDFNLDNASFTDKNLVAELINHDIMLERCKALITKEGVLVTDVVAGVSENGEEFYRPEVSKHWEAYERIQKKRNEIYQLMMATRRDNKDKEGSGDDSITKAMADMFATDFVVEERPEEYIDV
nr:MAG TPA: hypothetical protein [Caudoviricetes sp.]